MAAYLIADFHVHDPERYSDYTAVTPSIISRHGGEFVVRGGKHEVTEGPWQPNRIVVVKFPDYQSAEDFVNDPEYLEIKKIRLEASEGSMLIVEGA